MDAQEVNDAGDRPVVLRLWGACFLLLVSLAYGNLESLDTAFTMQAARALVRRGDSGLLQQQNGGDSLAEVAAADYVAAHSGVAFGMTGKDGVHQYVWFPIGHVWLMAPVVALGERLATLAPELETRFAERAGPLYYEGQFVVSQGLVAVLLPALFGASTVVLLFAIARVLGSSRREAFCCAIAIAFATQAFAQLRETLSDGPGLAFLLGALYVAVRVLRSAAGSSPGALALLLGGASAGAAVLTRYQHAFLVLAIGGFLAVHAWRQRAWRSLAWFALGGLPMALLLVYANASRFGHPLVTGYPPPLSWFDTPPWQGLPKLSIAAGKGILWLSPMLWLAFRAACSRDLVPHLRGLAWTLFAIPMFMFSCTNGWQSGQCWGARYVTGGIVALLAIALPQARPWVLWPRAFRGLLGLGLLLALTSLLAPTRGHNQLAGQSVLAHYEALHARGEITDVDLESVRQDQADRFFTMPRWSPVFANWRYAQLVLQGSFEDENGNPRNGAEHTIEALFGTPSADPSRGLAPIHFEDRSFRWFACVFWGELLGLPWWLLFALPLVPGLALARGLRRRLSQN